MAAAEASARLSYFQELLSKLEYEYTLLLAESAVGAGDSPRYSSAEKLKQNKHAGHVSLDDVNVDGFASRGSLGVLNRIPEQDETDKPLRQSELLANDALTEYLFGDSAKPFEPLEFESDLVSEDSKENLRETSGNLRETSGDSAPLAIRPSKASSGERSAEVHGFGQRQSKASFGDKSSEVHAFGQKQSRLSQAFGQKQSRSSFAFQEKQSRGSIGMFFSDAGSFIRRGSSLVSYESAAGTFSGTSMQVFPIWWNPSKAVVMEMKRRALLEKNLYDAKVVDSAPMRCIVSPVIFPKLVWDFMGFTLALYDAWATPFQLVFVSDDLKLNKMKFMDTAIMLFFALDVILNFNTGVVVRDKICFDRQQIACKYLQSWFWLDLVATVPWDMLYQGAALSGLFRCLKVVRVFRTARYIARMQTIKALQKTGNEYFTFASNSAQWVNGSMACVALALNIHMLSCLWLAMQLDEWVAHSFSEAMDIYFDTFLVQFLAVSTGSRSWARSTGTKFLEMFIAVEHVFVMVIVAAYAVFRALLYHQDSAKLRVLHDHTLKYMRRHKLPMRTQIEVMTGLNEASATKNVQKDFNTLTSSDLLPEELQRKIAYELWGGKLMTLGLVQQISEWDDDFCRSLSLCCREEVFSTQSVLFSEDDLSISAYHVLSGELMVSCALLDSDIPNFRAGAWLGENALVNTSFRRGLKAVTICLTSVMVVPSKAFQDMLRDSQLTEHYEDFVRLEVWHGLCGRCGSVGDHFFQSCPLRYVTWRETRPNRSTTARRLLRKQTTMQLSKTASDGMSDLIHELIDFLQDYECFHLLPYLNELQVYSLQELEELNMESFAEHLSKSDPPVELTVDEELALSANRVKKYREALHKGIEAMTTRVESRQHLMFLSHYKMEAGTEASLMRSELEQMIVGSAEIGSQFDAPIFLDSEDLTDLHQLQMHVKRSYNVILLLTNGVLTRPWVLVELVTAVQNGIPVLPVEVTKPGVEFEFPGDQFYNDLLAGKTLDDSAIQFLAGVGIDLGMVKSTLNSVFYTIAVPYSPHRPMHVRTAELQSLLNMCTFRGETAGRMGRLHRSLRSGGKRRSGRSSDIQKQESRKLASVRSVI